MMKKFLMLFLGLLLFVPISALAVEKGSDEAPPVEQTLVREGDFALRLAGTLSLAKTENEADAERALASARIAPKNGWISDFPVTPDVLAEIKASVLEAAEGGRIKMDKKTVEDSFYALGKDMELPIVADNSAAPAGRIKGYVTGEEYGEAPDYQDQAVITNYYYDEGPPVITYYPPPPDYAYLYAWDPYPFWWGGYWFPGYYVLNDFTIIVANDHHGGHHHHHHHDGWHDRGAVTSERTGHDTKLISNRVVDSSTNRVTTIDPVTRNTRTSNDFSRSGGSSNTTRFTNPDTRRGAENILRNSVTRGGATSFIPSGRVGRGSSGISSNVGRRSSDPAPSLRGRSSDSGRPSYGGQRQFAPASRSMSSGSGYGARGFSSPRSFSPAPSGGFGGFRSPGSSGGGSGRGGGFGGGSHGGGGCRGGRC